MRSACSVGDRNDRHLPRAFHRRLVVDAENRLPIGRAVEQTINVVRRLQLDAVDRQDVVADRDFDAGRRQRRAQVRIPALVVVDARDLVAAVLDREVGAEQSARRRRHVGHVAAAHVRVADGDLGAHLVEQVVQIGAVIDVRQQRAVHLLHLRPVGAVHVRHVQIVALVAPALIEDLLELFLRIQIHPQRHVEPAGPACGRRAIGIDEEQVAAGAGAPTRRGRRPPPPPAR